MMRSYPEQVRTGDVVSMRKIGTAGVECFDGPCIPFSKDGCVSCAIRPMKIYQGNGNTETIRSYCHLKGYGLMASPGGCTTPQHFDYYAIDNGAFSAWLNNRGWNPEHYLKFLLRLTNIKTPDFLVVPDLVAEGSISLEFSLCWRDRLPSIDTRYYLAVQDGMTYDLVSDVIRNFDGVFVGGTLQWKMATGEHWTQLAHNFNLPCHVGRVGPEKRIAWASRIGVDSIDSTSWPRNNTFHYIENAKMMRPLSNEQG